MKRKLKLFIWHDFSPDYTGGLAVAVAHDEAEARALIIGAHGHDPKDYGVDQWGTLEVREIAPTAVCVSGGG